MSMQRETNRGSAVVLLATTFAVLTFGLALVIDGGNAFDLRRRLQKAADAGAVAAAQELRRGAASTYTSAARRDAARNGYGVDRADVQVLRPPATGVHAGDSNFVEVRVRSDAQLLFARAFRGEPIPVEAVAVAGVVPADTCLFVLDPAGAGALWATGTANVNLGNCGIHVNSSSAAAARTNGRARIQASRIDIVGDYSGNGFAPTPSTGVTAQDDPWAHLTMPPKTSCDHAGPVTVTGDAVLSPGTYCGGISVTAGATVEFLEGTYLLRGGGLKAAGHSTLRGDGVTFVLAEDATYPYGGVDFLGTSNVDLTAPKTGPYAGILFFQDREVRAKTGSKFAGTSDSRLAGGLYFPTTDLKFVGTTSANLFDIVAVAHRVEFHGTVEISAPTAASGLFTPNLLRAALVY